MNNQSKHNHMIDFLFPVALFFVFALSAIIVILIAVRVYQSTVDNSYLNYTARTSLSYISEKVHQNDVDGKVEVAEFDGCPTIRMTQMIGDKTFYTYIYADGKELKELFVRDGVAVDASSGQTILNIENFELEEISNGLLKVTCTDENNQTASMLIGRRSIHS